MSGLPEVMMLEDALPVNPFISTNQENSQNKRGKGRWTLERVRELLSYDPETGVLIRLITTSNRVPKGTVAGRNNGNGYLRIMMDGYTDYAHRIAWFHFYGEWPEYEIDHRDGDGTNNRISNLREATPTQNRQNLSLRSTNKSGMTGVSWMKGYGNGKPIFG